MSEITRSPFNINLKWNKGSHWSSASGTHLQCLAKGFAFKDGIHYSQEKLASLFIQILSDIPEAECTDRILALLSELNGTFAVVLRHNQWLFATVDRVRSTPLFYGLRSDEIHLSDDADCIKVQVGDAMPNPVSIKEFMLTGYVTGSDTLFPNIKQLQAGECLWCKIVSGRLQVTTHRYYRWLHGDYFEATKEELCEAMDRMHLRVFERLLRSVNGRTIVVPLSGGYDSRLIVTMLKRLEYENTIVFSYGHPDNKESMTSKAIAASLGFQWEFVPYSKELWHKWYRTEDWAHYFPYSHRYCSLPHLQDWPAVWALNQECRIPENSIFVPGHSADMPAGSRSVSLPELYEQQPFAEDLVIDAIVRLHYSLSDWPKEDDESYHILRTKIRCTLGNLRDYPDNASAFEYWDTAERQAKFIINSVRVYEFWDHGWALPFWDNEFLDFWSRVPLNYRRRKTLYNTYVRSLTSKFGCNASTHGHLKPWPRYILLNFIKGSKRTLGKSSLQMTTKTISQSARAIRDYFNHPLQWYGILAFKDYIQVRPTPQSINSLLLYLYLNQKPHPFPKLS